ncbi:MAG: DUF2232 domain-containing protein [Magnetovibrionaceae bacterium]
MAAILPKALMFGLASGVCYLVLALGSPIGILTAYIAPLPLLVFGFQAGLAPAALAAAGGVALVIILQGLQSGGLYAVTMAMPAVLVVQLALTKRTQADGSKDWFPIGNVLAMLSGMAAGVVTGVGLSLMMDQPGFAGSVEAVLGVWMDQTAGALPMEARDTLVEQIRLILPGMAAVSFVVLVSVNAIIAVGFTAKRGQSIRPRPVYSEVRLPEWAAIAMVASAALAVVTSGDLGYLGRNLAIAFAAAWCFQGLAVAHVAARKIPASGLALGVMYGLLFFGGMSSFLIAAFIGLLDHLLDLRGRIKQRV